MDDLRGLPWESYEGVEGFGFLPALEDGASLVCAATRDMKAVALRLGHSSTRMMDQVYVEIYHQVSRKVADAIDSLVEESRL